MASESRDSGGTVKILIAGSLGGTLEAELAARPDLEVFDPHTNGNGQPAEPDAILYAGSHPQQLESDVSALRTWTKAPVVVAATAPTDALLSSLLRLDVADVVALPQTAESLAFTMKKAAIAATSFTRGSGRLVTIFSPKGGSGKTIISTSLAVAAATAGSKTLLVDLDLQFGDAAMMLGVTPRTTVLDVAAASGELDSEKLAGYVTEHESGLALLAAPLRPEDADAVHDHALRRILKVAKANYDVVIVDSSPHFDPAVLTALETTDALLLVSVPEVTALKNLRVGLRTLGQLPLDLEDVRIVLNREGMPQALSARDVEHVLERSLDFVLPNEPVVSAAINRGMPVVSVDKKSSFAKAVTVMASNLFNAASVGQEASGTTAPKPSSGVAPRRRAIFAGKGAR
jgi:pilus assembly protein CpaE